MRRRDFLIAAASAALVSRVHGQEWGVGSYLSAWAERDSHGELRYRAGQTDQLASVELPQRAHGIVAHPTEPGCAFIVARRPGEYLLRVNVVSGLIEAACVTDESFRFEGHAIVDRTRGRVLATETDLLTGGGRVGVFDSTTLERIASWSTHGIGPHELIEFKPGVIAVANGGILTLPETGRVKRNLDTMKSSLVLLDATDGERQAEYTLADRRAGIRHLALAADGTLGAALQIEGETEQPLLAVLRAGELRIAEAPSTNELPLARYGAGVAACGDRFAVACTHGHCIAVWDHAGQFIARIAMRSPSGLIASGNRSGWVASNAFGELVSVDVETLQTTLIARSGRLWDNHLAHV